MLGTSKSRRNGDFGLVGRIGKKFGYELQAEWMRIDQIWYHYLPSPENWEQQPWRTDVVIEHENNIDNFEYTLFKLGEVSAPLKVGIFYPIIVVHVHFRKRGKVKRFYDQYRILKYVGFGKMILIENIH